MQKKTVKEIAHFLEGDLIGDGSVEISGICDIKEAKSGDITFLLDTKFLPHLNTTNASCVVVPAKLNLEKAKCPLIRSKNPALAFVKLVEFIMPSAIPHPKGISKNSEIGKNVSLGEGAAVAPYVFIADDAAIGKKTVLYPFSYIGKGTKIGDNCIIYPNVSIRENV
ncbi:MAG: UDP-3-O-(3-hydroxymyristoyl)glucosamine N-acyltransferase, partial [Candidatus Omnitrophica bacterium]|nr:UDP-3-O-(3-hydroxymyristoyl)glucosamine N-acyltransferase [Candidatus Omnitrophota bacterium]